MWRALVREKKFIGEGKEYIKILGKIPGKGAWGFWGEG